MAQCPKCGAAAEPGASYCLSCGAALAATGITYEATGAPDAPAMVTQHAPTLGPGPAPAPDLGRPLEQSTAIVALILNILIWPGLGSLIGGEKVGWAQGFLNLLGLVLVITIVGAIVGIPLMIGMWVWGIVTGVQLINRANAQQQARLTAR